MFSAPHRDRSRGKFVLHHPFGKPPVVRRRIGHGDEKWRGGAFAGSHSIPQRRDIGGRPTPITAILLRLNEEAPRIGLIGVDRYELLERDSGLFEALELQKR